MRSARDYQEVRRLVVAGHSDYEVARRTGIPRSTVQRWRVLPPRTPPADFDLETWRPPVPSAYSYVLGLYLGDGHLVTKGRSGFLRIAFDELYPGVIAEGVNALAVTFPHARVRSYSRTGARRLDLQVSGRPVVAAFPQHGPGKKHLRPIILEPWQSDVTRRYPEHLIRGLIHSDGSRCINRFKTRLPSGRVAEYAYPRYFFTNESADIRRIFCEHCEMLGIRWTQSNHRNISISHRDSVAIMDRIVGPKA